MMNKENSVCRVCLRTEIKKYISLYEKYKQYLIFEYINSLTSIEIKENDGLPNKICNSCFKQLQTAIIFQQTCETSNITLRKALFQKDHGLDWFKFNIKIEKQEYDEIKVEDECNLNVDHFSDHIDQVIELIQVPVYFPKNKPVEQNVECHDCGGIFKTKCKLRVHWKKVHMLPNLICENCKRTFKSYKALNMHKNRNIKSCKIATNVNLSIEGLGKARVFICKVCSYKTTRIKDMSAHLVTHTGERPFKCDLCSNTYTQYSSLQGHKEGAHKNYVVEVTCQYCGKYVRGRRNVYRHLKGHTEVKVTCDICKKVMNKKSYDTHMKRHSGIKSYTCEKCASTFYTSAELCNHKRWVHNKTENILKCEICDYKCLKVHNMKKHQIKHTEKNHSCTHCGRFYPSAEKLSLHVKCHFDEKKHECPQCKMKFYNRDSVRKHMRAKHSLTYLSGTDIKKKNTNKLEKDDIEIVSTPIVK